MTKQLKFLNSHCSIACSYCSVVCLIAKNELKNDRSIEFSSSLKLNEIHMVDNSFNEDPKNIIFSREALISGERPAKNEIKDRSHHSQHNVITQYISFRSTPVLFYSSA